MALSAQIGYIVP